MRILHLSDLHLDRPFPALPQDAAAALRGDLRQALERVVTLARERAVEVVTLAGDLWEEAHVTAETRAFVRRALAALAPRAVLRVGGNHDPVAGAGEREPADPHVHVFPGGGPAELRLGSVSFWGISWTPAGLDLSGLERLRVPSDGRVHVLLVHAAPRGLPQALAGRGAYGELDPGIVERCGFRLCLAGHVHDALSLGPLAYPGSPEPLGWTGRGRNGCLIVDLEQPAARLEVVPLATRRWIARRVDCTGATTVAQIGARVAEALRDPAPGSLIVRLRLVGTSDVVVDLEALARAHRRRYAALVLRDGCRRPEPSLDLAVPCAVRR